MNSLADKVTNDLHILIRRVISRSTTFKAHLMKHEALSMEENRNPFRLAMYLRIHNLSAFQNMTELNLKDTPQ